MKRHAFISFFLILSFFTQSQVNLDSLWAVWNDETAPDSSLFQPRQGRFIVQTTQAFNCGYIDTDRPRTISNRVIPGGDSVGLKRCLLADTSDPITHFLPVGDTLVPWMPYRAEYSGMSR